MYKTFRLIFNYKSSNANVGKEKILRKKQKIILTIEHWTVPSQLHVKEAACRKPTHLDPWVKSETYNPVFLSVLHAINHLVFITALIASNKWSSQPYGNLCP